MNFEYKVGYLWKYHEEDPGLQSWNWGKSTKPLGRKVQSARADWSSFVYRQCFASGCQLWCYFMLFRTAKTWGSRNSSTLYFFSFFSFLFSFPLIPLLVLPSAGCWILHFGGLRVPGLKKLKLGSCPDRPSALPTSAGSCGPRFLLNRRANSVKINFVSKPPNLFLVKVGIV